MRRSQPGKLRYLLIAAILIIAMVAIIRMVLPEPVPDEHAGQVYLNDGFDMVWITPFENVPVSTLTAQDFRTENGIPTYVGDAYRTALGVDVSEHQHEVDWFSAAQTLDFAYIRLGYRGYTEGGLFVDPWFETNISGANAAGLDTGVYFFSQATNEVEAVEEASMVLHMVEKYNVSYPIFLDVENSDIYPNGRADGIDRTLRTKVIAAFCQTINNSGYKGGVYANKYWLNNMLNAKDLTQYKIWLAQYNSEVTYTTTRYDLWQYSSKGSINGISGNVDLNHSYLGY